MSGDGVHLSTWYQNRLQHSRRFHMKDVIYEKFGAVLQMQYFVYYAVPAVFGGKCVVYGLNSSTELAGHFVALQRNAVNLKS